MITVIANLKGGTGKSTVAFNLAVWLRSLDRRIAVIDLDPQRTLSDVAALRTEEAIEPALWVEAGPFSEVSFPENAEEIIIDVGTADLESFKQAIMIADRILIPVTPSQADIWSTQRFISFLNKNTHGNPPESLTFLNRVDTGRASQAAEEAAMALNTLPGIRLIPQRLPDRAVFRDSFSESLAVFELEPRSAASRDFRALAESLFDYGRRSMLSRLQKQKISAATDPAFRQALATPSGEPSVAARIGYPGPAPTPPAGKDEPDWERGGKKGRKRKGKQGKKGGKEKRSKEGKKSKKSRKGKKGS